MKITAGDDVRRLQLKRVWRLGSGENTSRDLDSYKRARLLASAVISICP
jgi:hypothetical protein